MSQAQAPPVKDRASADAKFGTLTGVFTPSILTILGVIMYLRFGWVVGNAGMIGTIAVVVLAHVISFTTGMSISSIATNRTVRKGGDYYMISRSLGLPIGGAIGLALFFALALSTSLYILGFAESLLGAFGWQNSLINRQIIGSITCVVITGITFISTSLALRLQYFVLAAIVLSLVSLFIGGSSSSPPTEGMALWFGEGSESFETVFGVFFPAVTGFTAGVAMSGDLKDPRKSIPIGTMGAITVGLVVYLAIPVFLARGVDTETLKTDPMVWMRVAYVSQVVIAGVFAATISSALGSVLGAPRYLQALALDGVVPRFLGKGYGALNEPRIGTIVTFLVAEAGIIAGELDMIARIITMFFLTSYGFLCLACGVQTWSGISSFRPTFKTPAWVSFIGAITCLGTMFKLDTTAMAGATIIMVMVYAFLQRRRFRASPKDTWGGFWAAVVQKGLLHLHHRSSDSKNWRPNAIVFAGEPSARQHLIYLARWIMQSRGLSTYFYLIKGDILEQSRHAAHIEPLAGNAVNEIYPEMLTRVSVASDVYEGIISAAQSYGLSGMVPNTVIMGWGEESDQPAEFTRLVRSLLALDHNLIFVEHDEKRSFGKNQSIDVWWGGIDRNGELMLLLAYFLRSSFAWAHARVRINVLVDNEENLATLKGSLEKVIKDARVRAEPNIIMKSPAPTTIQQMIAEASKDTDLVIMGLREPLEDETDSYVEHVGKFLEGLGTVILVRASTQFQGASILFDEE